MKVTVFMFVAIFVGICIADKMITTNGITTKVKGQSGKISVYASNMTEADGITITFDAMKEFGGSEALIDHSYQNFAQLDFIFSNVTEGTYPNSSVDVSMFSFMADIPIDNVNAKLTTFIYMFKENGNITVDDEDIDVKAGQMKFNIMVENWTFCNPCKNKGQDVSGDSLHVDIYVKAKQAPKKSDKNATYELGGGSTMIVPKWVSTRLFTFFYLGL